LDDDTVLDVIHFEDGEAPKCVSVAGFEQALIMGLL